MNSTTRHMLVAITAALLLVPLAALHGADASLRIARFQRAARLRFDHIYRRACLIAAVLVALVSAAVRGSGSTPDFESWPVVITQKSFRVEVDGIHRVGFTLPPESRGRRVAVAFLALLDSPEAAGYRPALALEVDGEVMGLQLAGQPRLLNRPMEWHFGKTRHAVQSAGTDGKLGLIDNVGSARWTLAYAPSKEAFLASANYAPTDV